MKNEEDTFLDCPGLVAGEDAGRGFCDSPAADRAALNAVEVTAPFRPLPAEFKGQYIDIQFTFDYNVFGATGY